MSRTAVIVMVAFAAYALLDMAWSAAIALLWRTRAVAPAHLPPTVRARRLLQLRLFPSLAAAAITLAVVTPAFAIFEPPGAGETLGPALLLLSVAGIVQITMSALIAVRSLWLTARIERQWLQRSRPLDVASSTGLPAFSVEAASPIVALVGVFAPKLIAAERIVGACSTAELSCIIGHERGHLQSRDNLKRWMMAFVPDALRWTRIHHEIVDAWHHAAEDAADDAATGADVTARADLAALLLKIVRLAPPPAWNTAIISPFVQAVSPFVETDGLERRVRRLLRPELEPPAPIALAPALCVAALAAGVLATVSSPDTLEAVFEAFERLVAFGR